MNPESTTTLKLDGVALKTNPDVEYIDGIDPYNAQVQLLELFENESEFIAMNTEVTGGGKTDGWLTPVCKNQINTICTYPRNTLIEDQESTIKEFAEVNFPDVDIGVVKFTSAELLRLASEQVETNLTKGKTLTRKLTAAFKENDSVIVLTNPHIFVQMARGMYKGTHVQRDFNRFECTVFDEFHLASNGEKITLLSIIEEQFRKEEHYSPLSKVVLLSATPDKLTHSILQEHIDAPFHEINSRDGRRPLTEVSTIVDGDYIPDDGWRAVMPPVDLEVKTAQTFQTHKTLLSDETFSKAVEFCLGGQTVVMVDGVKEVGRIHSKLQRTLSNKTVNRIDGLHKTNLAEKIKVFDVLVSNSAVEVGIDFTVDRVIFSAPKADSFMQRIGRLRNRSDLLQAVAYVPNYVVDRINALDISDERISRAGLELIINDTYRDSGEPDIYIQIYSAAELWRHCMDAEAEMLSEYATSIEYKRTALDMIRRLCFEPFDEEFSHEVIHDIVNNIDEDILEHIQSFQPGGLNSLVYNEEDNEVQTYDPLGLISTSRVTGVTKREFYSHLPSDAHTQRAKNNESHSAGYFIYHGDREIHPDTELPKTGLVPTDAAGRIRRELNKPRTEARPVLTSGFEILVDNPGLVPGLEKVNEEIREHKLLAYPAHGTSHHLREVYGGSAFFQTHTLLNVSQNASVALGEDALMLHCRVLDKAQRETNYVEQFEQLDIDRILNTGVLDEPTLNEVRTEVARKTAELSPLPTSD